MLSNWKSEAGSAVTDFVLLVVPASLLVLPLLELFGLYQSAIVKQQVSYEIARFGALADVSLDQAVLNGRARDSNVKLSQEISALSCSFVSNALIQRRISFWPEMISVPIEARAQCEN